MAHHTNPFSGKGDGDEKKDSNGFLGVEKKVLSFNIFPATSLGPWPDILLF